MIFERVSARRLRRLVSMSHAPGFMAVVERRIDDGDGVVTRYIVEQLDAHEDTVETWDREEFTEQEAYAVAEERARTADAIFIEEQWEKAGDEWSFDTSCYPYSDNVSLSDGRSSYCVSRAPCEQCGCTVARYEPDADGDSEGYRDCTTYACAACAGDIEACWHDAMTVERFKKALAVSMFRPAELRTCECCKLPTAGSIGAAGMFWARICQACKDSADDAMERAGLVSVAVANAILSTRK